MATAPISFAVAIIVRDVGDAEHLDCSVEIVNGRTTAAIAGVKFKALVSLHDKLVSCPAAKFAIPLPPFMIEDGEHFVRLTINDSEIARQQFSVQNVAMSPAPSAG